MTVKNPTEIVVLCENMLGFTHNPAVPLWKGRSLEAHKIKVKMTKEPGVTLDDLALAIDYCRLRGEPVKSPVALFWRVEDARKMANAVVTPLDLSASVQRAVDWELLRPAPDPYWLGRLTRAHGEGRKDVLDEWAAAGRG